MSAISSQLKRVADHLLSVIQNAGVRYYVGVSGLLVLGVLGEIAAHRYLAQGSVVAALSSSLGEAFLVSAILASIVDPFLKRRLQMDSGWDAVFGYLNPNAPVELRAALQELAVCKQYLKQVRWTANFTWHNDERTILCVVLEARNVGLNVDRVPYRPRGRLWVLASTAGYRTDYLRYSLSCPGHIETVEMAENELQAFIVRESDGSIYLDEQRLVGDRAIPTNVPFENLKRARMHRQSFGYVPLHHSKFGETLTVRLEGPALVDLDVSVSHPSQEGKTAPSEWKRLAADHKGNEERRFGRCTPGQVTLLSWSPAARS